ncbi:MAG: exonuclease subunit SbcD [Acidobacteriota bacterium]
MRLLHTADWHLGARFHDRRRGADEEHALAQIVDLCRQRAVDAVLVAGDVFDTANPGGEEQQRYYRTLARLVDDPARGGAGVGTVVVTAGNHDGALRLDGPRELLATLRIHVVGRWPRAADAGDCVVTLRDRDGQARAVCAAVPFLRDGDLRLAAPAERRHEIHARYAEALGARYTEARRAAREHAPELPLVVMGHCTVVGFALGGEERAVRIGTLDQVDASALAGDAAYLALGHIHKPQAVGAVEHWRYSGSLLPTGFDEAGIGREVVLVDLPSAVDEADTAAAIERVPLEPYRRYCRLRGDPGTLRRQIGELEPLDTEPPSDGQATGQASARDDSPAATTPWCEATVVLDAPEPGIARELGDLAAERGWALVSVKRETLRDVLGQEPTAPLVADDLHHLDPFEVFERLHESKYGHGPDDALRREFEALLDEVEQEAQSAAETEVDHELRPTSDSEPAQEPT